MASLDSEVLKALIDYAKSTGGVTCDSVSGEHCEDGHCASRVMPVANEALWAVLDKHGITL